MNGTAIVTYITGKFGENGIIDPTERYIEAQVLGQGYIGRVTPLILDTVIIPIFLSAFSESGRHFVHSITAERITEGLRMTCVVTY